jgi:hypothetical protein
MEATLQVCKGKFRRKRSHFIASYLSHDCL